MSWPPLRAHALGRRGRRLSPRNVFRSVNIVDFMGENMASCLLAIDVPLNQSIDYTSLHPQDG